MYMMVIASIIILATIVMAVVFKGLKQQPTKDSAIKQRMILNAPEQLIFKQLKDVLPSNEIFAHVSYGALLTTKLTQTKRKYEAMFADFVVIGDDYKVMAVISLCGSLSLKREKTIQYQKSLLEEAGYQVFLFDTLPSNEEIAELFSVSNLVSNPLSETTEHSVSETYEHFKLGRISNARAFG